MDYSVFCLVTVQKLQQNVAEVGCITVQASHPPQAATLAFGSPRETRFCLQTCKLCRYQGRTLLHPRLPQQLLVPLRVSEMLGTLGHGTKRPYVKRSP